jgi:4-amino-4-deoxy-L-arabinose transferase-like glycosyltransferase
MLASVLAAVLVLYPLVLAPAIPLLDPDEGLHASIAQEMVERGDWIVPRLLGEPFLDKPILYFWAEAASLKIFGMSEAAVRLPGLLFGLLGAWTTALLAGRLFDRRTGVLAGLFYGTMVLPIALMQAAAHDVALVPWVNLALLAFWQADHVRRIRLESLMYTAVAGVALGLAILTKGLAGVALVGIAYAGYLLIARRLTLASCARGALALAIAGAIASAWYVAVEIRIPGYLHYYFVERHVLGFATDSQAHGNARWWYYLPILLVGGLPWIAYLPAALQDGLARWKIRRSAAKRQEMRGGTRTANCRLQIANCKLQIDEPSTVATPPLSARHTALATARPGSPNLLLWWWLIGCTLFLSLSHSKLVTYIWPVFPVPAILVAVAWGRLLQGEMAPGARRSMAWTLWSASLLGPLALPLTLAIAGRHFGLQFAGLTWLVAAAIALATWVPAWFWRCGRLRAVPAAAMLVIAAHFAFLMTAVLPHVAPRLSARELAQHFNHDGRIPPRVFLAEERLGSLVFYLAPQLRAGLQAGQLQPCKLDKMAPLSCLKPGEVLAVPEKKVPRNGLRGELSEFAYERVDRYRLYRSAALSGEGQTAERDGLLR